MTSAPEPIFVDAEKLKRAHFEQSRVWAFLLDGEGGQGTEASLRTASYADVVPGTDGSYLVSATYTLKRGQSFPGAVQIDVIGKRVTCEAAFVYLLDRQLAPVATETDRLLSRFTKAPGNGPKSWTLDVTLPGESKARRGRIRKSLGFHLASLVLRLAMSVIKRRMKANATPRDSGPPVQ